MGKYHGFIGFGTNEEKATDIWDDSIIERHYYGDIERNATRYSQSDTLSGDLQITNQFSIIGDTFAFRNYTRIRYITWQGERWMVSSVEEKYPRLIINIGGIFNGQTPTGEQDTPYD